MFELLLQTAWAPVIVAPVAGSFLGVLVCRLPAGRPVVWGRSACAACGTPIPPRHLLPLASFLWLRARAACCGQRIPRFLPAIELEAIGVAALAAIMLPPGGTLWASCLLGWALLALAWIDTRHFLLPDVLTLPLLLAGLAATGALQPDRLGEHALAAILGWTSFRALAWLHARLRGRSGLGGGDAKLLAAGGAWVGLAALPFVVAGAALLGILHGVGLAMRRAARGRRPPLLRLRLPFGPSLSAAIWLAWLFEATHGQGR